LAVDDPPSRLRRPHRRPVRRPAAGADLDRRTERPFPAPSGRARRRLGAVSTEDRRAAPAPGPGPRDRAVGTTDAAARRRLLCRSDRSHRRPGAGPGRHRAPGRGGRHPRQRAHGPPRPQPLPRAARGHDRARTLTLTSGFVPGHDVFRFVDCGAQDAFESNARLPVLGRNVGEGKGPIFLTSIWGSTHLNVGWFDDVDATLDLDLCADLGIQVLRRPVYGGGTAYYEEGSAVTWAWLLPKDTHPD